MRKADCFDPKKMAKSKTDCIERFDKVLTSLVNAKKVVASKCDVIKQQYQVFLNGTVNGNISGFDYKKGRLDELFAQFINKDDHAELWQVVKLILIMSHGQASVERGFSIMKQGMKDNLAEDSFVFQRVVIDHIKSVGGCCNVTINSELRKEVKQSRSRYILDLETKRNDSTEQLREKKRKTCLEELEDLKAKRKRLLTDADTLEKSANELSAKAEKARSFNDVKSFITQSNSHRNTANMKMENAKRLDSTIEEKQEILKTI